ncbi:DNA-binding transcriptional regulator AraC [compost metagenome]
MNDFPDFEIRSMRLSGNIEVRKMGESYPISILQARHYSFFILFWATEGKGTHLIEHTIYDIIPGRLFLIHPGHLYQIKDYPKQGWMILFSHAMFLTFIKQHTEQEEAGMFSFYNLVPYLDLMKNRGLFQNLAKRLYEEINIESHISVLQHYLSIFLLHVNSNYAVQQKITFISPATRMTLKLKKLIDADYLKNRDAKHYANKLGTTPRILNRLSEKMLGHRVSMITRDRVIATAKQRLAENTTTIKHLAIDLNFSDTAAFVNFFKRHTGITPSEFKKNLKEEML